MGSSLLDGFAADMVIILTPRMIRSRRVRDIDVVIQGFGVNDFSLALGLVVQGVVEGVVFIEDGNVSFHILADGDMGVAHGIPRALRLDLVDCFVVLNSQIFGKGACLLMGEDDVQVFSLEQRAVSVMVAARLNGKPLVEVLAEFRQIGIASFYIRDTPQT